MENWDFTMNNGLMGYEWDSLCKCLRKFEEEFAKPWAIDFEMIYLVSLVIFNSYLKLPEGTIILKRCTLHLWPSNNKEAMGKSMMMGLRHY